MATLYSYHVSHEQFSPRELLDLAVAAEQAGFDAAFSSDHLQPWAPQQGHSGFTWSWLGAALQATRRLPFSAITVPIGLRYHPAVIAQAVATLGEMFPGRVPWIALGSGEALNESVMGMGWPGKEERNARLKEAFFALRELLEGKTVTREGPPATVDGRIWSRPVHRTRLIIAARSEETARWAAPWAEGLLAVGVDAGEVGKVVSAFHDSGGEGKPTYLKADVSWDVTDDKALDQAHAQWRFNAVGGDAATEFRTPAEFERAAASVKREDMQKSVIVSSDASRIAERLRQLARLGFESIDIHNVGTNQRSFIDMAGQKLLPLLRS